MMCKALVEVTVGVLCHDVYLRDLVLVISYRITMIFFSDISEKSVKNFISEHFFLSARRPTAVLADVRVPHPSTVVVLGASRPNF